MLQPDKITLSIAHYASPSLQTAAFFRAAVVNSRHIYRILDHYGIIKTSSVIYCPIGSYIILEKGPGGYLQLWWRDGRLDHDLQDIFEKLVREDILSWENITQVSFTSSSFLNKAIV